MNVSESVSRDDLLNEIKSFYLQLLYAKDMIKTYFDASAAEKTVAVAKGFFKMVVSACADSYLITLARMYDRDGKSKTIQALIKKCKEQKNLFVHPDSVFDYLTEADRALKKVGNYKTTIETIIFRRNKRMAHNDAEYFDLDPSTGTVIDDGKYLPRYLTWELVSFTEKLLKFLMSELNYDSSEMKEVYAQDLPQLIPEMKDRQFRPQF